MEKTAVFPGGYLIFSPMASLPWVVIGEPRELSLGLMACTPTGPVCLGGLWHIIHQPCEQILKHTIFWNYMAIIMKH